MDHEDRYLTIYLQDHLTAATGGINLTRRAKGSAKGRDEELHAFYGGFEEELLEERRSLLGFLSEIGAGPHTAKALAATVGERLGRLKLNGHLLSRSPYSDLVELEGLSIAVQGKRLGWIALQERAHPRFDPTELARLVTQAEDQHDRLEALRRPRAARILAGLAPTPAS
ncbi:unannotated protein [freshwater metagenome]|uniref:Unannotated protein n=1 Tax=freshwater metagenome TaxID=449393 RepID=A0A6J7JEQ1_9ZZZZ|nr:hypothetical protein [Actinomycetota bacterium]